MADTPRKAAQKRGEQVFGYAEKGDTTRVAVHSALFNNTLLLHVREQYVDSDGDWKPTRKGFTLRTGQQIDELIAALRKARKAFS